MKTRTKLPYHQNGMRYGYNSENRRICIGAKMGRQSYICDSYMGHRLALRRVPLDQGYDPGGAYWGCPSDLWCAWSSGTEVYVRARTRTEAIAKVMSYFKQQGRTAPKFNSPVTA